MKTMSTFLTVLILLGLLAGCQQTTGFKEVSIANMKLDVQAKWQKTDNYEELVDNFYDEWTSGIEYFPIDVYQIPNEDVYLIIGIFGISQYDEDWEGWSSLLEVNSMHNFCASVHGLFLSEIIIGIIGPDDIELIEGPDDIWPGDPEHEAEREAVEKGMTYKVEQRIVFKVGDKTYISYILSTFSKNDLGHVLMCGEENTISKYEESWQEIMDSVQIT